MSEHNVDLSRLLLVPEQTETTEPSTDMNRESSDDRTSPPPSVVLRSLEDDKCRTLLTALHEPTSATALRTECDMPRSTVYRKLERLGEAGLVREYTEVRRDGPNATLYERDFTDISIGIDENDEFTVSIERPDRDATDRMATFWTEMKKES
ncbi:helix-turn-helix domain-containing protein [Haladaptatus sp. CMAA 1911]|uniref:helix-turn-helix domain-containing protein n=1 Tax=unclassified Haladaptatus TaxID=2622732 RepID=UPI0037552192